MLRSSRIERTPGAWGFHPVPTLDCCSPHIFSSRFVPSDRSSQDAGPRRLVYSSQVGSHSYVLHKNAAEYFAACRPDR